MARLVLSKVVDSETEKKISFAAYLRDDFVERSLVIYLDSENRIESLYFSSYKYGSTEWINGEGLQEHRLWENEEQAEGPTYLTRRHTVRLSNGLTSRDYAREKILPDVLDNMEDRKISSMLRDIISGKSSPVKIDPGDFSKEFVMDDLTINLSPSEKARLLHNAENIFDKGHWGSSNIEIPEEQMLYRQIKESGEGIVLSYFDLKLLIQWMSDSTEYGAFLLPEDTSIINKLSDNLLRHYKSVKSKYQAELSTIERLLKSVERLSSGKGVEKNSYEDSDNKLQLGGAIDKIEKESHGEKPPTGKTPERVVQEKTEDNGIHPRPVVISKDKEKINIKGMLSSAKKFSENIFKGLKFFFRPDINKEGIGPSVEKSLSAAERLQKAEKLAKRINKKKGR